VGRWRWVAVGLDDLRGLSNLNDSMIVCERQLLSGLGTGSILHFSNFLLVKKHLVYFMRLVLHRYCM